MEEIKADANVDDFIRFIFFPVGHGSCTLVSLPPEKPGGARIYGVIDCHESSALPIREYLSNPWFNGEVVSKGTEFDLRFVALTHYHEDHFLGIDHLLGGNSSFRCKKFLSPFPSAGAVARRMKNGSIKAMLSKIQKLAPKPPNFFKIYGDLSWIYEPNDSKLKDIFKATTIAPSNSSMEKMRELYDPKAITPFNFLSSAIRFQWERCSIIIGGDVEEKEWKKIIIDLKSTNQLHLLSANVALCSHHGGRGNPDILWQRISRCSSLHKQQCRETERRVSRTIIIVSCGNASKKSPSKKSLQTFFNANSLVRCTSPAKICLKLHKDKQPSCISDNDDDMSEELIELPPGVKLVPSGMPDFPPSVTMARNYSKFKKGSICVDIFRRRSPQIYFHNGTEAMEITERCSCVTKVERR